MKQKTKLTFSKSGKLIIKPITKLDEIYITNRAIRIAAIIDGFNAKYGTQPNILDADKITVKIKKAAIIMSRKIRAVYNNPI